MYIYSLPFHSIEAEIKRCDVTNIMMPHLVLQHFSWALPKPGFAGVSTTTLWNLIRDLFNIYTSLNVYRHFLSLSSNFSPSSHHIIPHYILLNKLCTIPLHNSLYMLVRNNICPVSYCWHLAELYACMHVALSSSSPCLWYLQKIRIWLMLFSIFLHIYKPSVCYPSVWPSLQLFNLSPSFDCPHKPLVF